MISIREIKLLFRRGLVPDIFNSLAEKMNFTYGLQPSGDGMWGNIDEVSKGLFKYCLIRFGPSPDPPPPL